MNLNFAENFKRLRKEKDITQEKIAEVFGVTGQTISRWELNICYPDLELLPSIANYFGVTVDSLLSNDAHSKEMDQKIFLETIDTLWDKPTERIEFVQAYCRKYPENDHYAFHLIRAIRDRMLEDALATEKYMPIMLKNAHRLLETQCRNTVIQLMVTVCDEKDLPKWLGLSPYSGLSRRSCLVSRSIARNDAEQIYVQQGLENLETFAQQLDRRCPDVFGAQKKAEFQRGILKTIRSFGDGDEIPDGWKLFYAYKQLVLSACLFDCGETEEGWQNFDSAIEMCRYVFSLQEEWLEIGGGLFSNLKVSKDWNYAIDENGSKHKLFGIVNLSYYDITYISDLLTDPRWAWFDSVRNTPKYQAAVGWARSIEEKQKEVAMN